MIINILGGGPVELLPDLAQYKTKNALWLGVDRGVFTLLSCGIVPEFAFGDFDSVSKKEWEQIEKKVKNLHTFEPEKDETDMELALNWALEQKPKKIHIFGATGGRLDHFFGNVQILLKPELKNLATEIEIIDVKNHLFVKYPGHYSIEEKRERKYISFVPMTPSLSGLTLKGFKYPLTDCHIYQSSTLCISNELVSKVGTFSFSEGIVLVIRSND